MRKAHLFLVLYILLLVACSSQSQTAGNPIPVYYVGPHDGVPSALKIANFLLVDDPALAKVIVLNGELPASQLTFDQVQSGTGLVLILGPNLSSEQVAHLLNIPLELDYQEDAISISGLARVKDLLVQDIVWNSAPQIRERSDVLSPVSSLQPLVTSYQDGEWVLWSRQVGNSPMFILNAYLGNDNLPFQKWPYFNYLVYHLVVRAANDNPLSFADYEGSPVPHARERTILFVILLGMLLLAALIFVWVRRYSLAHPEALDVLVANRKEFEARQAGTDWNEVGFHRPLGGFMLAFMMGLVLFIPLIVYQNLILPVYILPSAQALGIWGRVTQFFNLLWVLFDMGTSAAFIKFFSEYRVHDPRKAIQFGQIFVWWQALSGAVQVALVAILASTAVPKTLYALYAWSIIIHTFIQIPGFYQVMRHTLMAWQRSDYAQILELSLAVLMPILVQPVVVTLAVVWGRNNPIYGEVTGGLIGMGLAAYAAEAITFFLGLLLYLHLGYNTRILFMAHFDWTTVKTAFRFGVFEMLGSAAWAVGQALEVLITQTRLINYNEIWGNWGLAQNFVFAFQVVGSLYNNLMPSISEAISNAHMKLSQYYSVMAYKWGGMISAFIGAVLLAVADRFILGASGPEFTRAAAYAIPLVIWGAIQYPSWVGDNVQVASNRPYLKTMLVAFEQIIRVVLALLLVARLQINALILAYFIGLFAKDITAYIINHRICYPQRFFFWQSLAAPLLAGAAHYCVVRWVTGLIWQGDQITSVLIFLIGILFSFPLFAFFYGLFGGWDDDTLSELKHAAALSGFTRPMARLFWAANSLGARLSPLHNRFPIDIRQAALEEAGILTNERVEL
jgi:O-antigen/teichoic acid export membrane protein